MTTLQGFTLDTNAQVVRDAPFLSDDIDSFAYDEWPPHETVIAATPQIEPGESQSRVPIAIVHRPIVGNRAMSYADIWYYCIHVVPNRIEVGNLASTERYNIEVWNAWLNQALPLTGLLESKTQGMQLAAPQAPPTTFKPNDSRIYTLTLNLNGPPVIDAAYEWQFSGQPNPKLVIVGQRVLVWPFKPDWQASIQERLIWLTDIISARDASEQRIRLRDDPRRQLQHNSLVHATDRQLLDSLLWGWQARTWAVPIWPDITKAAAPIAAGTTVASFDTTSRDVEAGVLIMAYDGPQHNELKKVDTVSATGVTTTSPWLEDWPQGTLLFPCRLGRMQSSQNVTSPTDNIARLNVLWSIADDIALDPEDSATTYRGMPVLERAVDWTGGRSAQWQRDIVTIDNSVATPTVIDTSGIGSYTTVASWLVSGRDDIEAVRQWLAARAGRLVPCWTHTGRDDITLIDTISNAQNVMTVAAAGHAQHHGNQPGRRDFRMALTDGTVLYRRVTVIAADSGGELISFDSVLGRVVQPADVARISWLMPARLDADAIDIIWQTNEMIRLNVPLRSINDDV